MINNLQAARIRKLIKKGKRSYQKYNKEQAILMIRTQFKIEEGLREDEMAEYDEDIRARIEENWPFEDVM